MSVTAASWGRSYSIQFIGYSVRQESPLTLSADYLWLIKVITQINPPVIQSPNPSAFQLRNALRITGRAGIAQIGCRFKVRTELSA